MCAYNNNNKVSSVKSFTLPVSSKIKLSPLSHTSRADAPATHDSKIVLRVPKINDDLG